MNAYKTANWLIIGLAGLSTGCASLSSKPAGSALAKPPAEVAPAPAVVTQEPAKVGAVGESVYIAASLAQLGDYLISGK
jgi:hypothetical protein